jgi:hypothetical protein
MEKILIFLFTTLSLKNPVFPLPSYCTKPLDIFSRLLPNHQFSQLYQKIKPIVPYQDYLLGLDRPTTYFIILQNDYELRTNGGFPGSYAVITLDQAKPTIRLEDIYTPDGQVTGYISPPPPIQTAFQLGSYRLRDADWSPDFPKTAATLRWFFQKGKEVNPNLMVTLNFTTIKKIVDLVGEINVPEYQFTLNADNFYLFLQNQTEVGFFAGSTQKKDVLSATSKALISRLQSLPNQQKIALINLLFDQLDQQNILINADYLNFQSFLQEKNYSGELKPFQSKHSDTLSDTFLAVEANLGANKANCCVSRQTAHEVLIQNNYLLHRVKILYENSSPFENPTKPLSYGGNYRFYLRLYIPQNAQNIEVDANDLDMADVYGLKEIGFFHLTKATQKSEINFEYRLPLQSAQYYQLQVLKQSGLFTSPQNLNLFGENFSSNLENDYLSDLFSIR